MAQQDIDRAFATAFGNLGYTYVSVPNGPTVDPPRDGTLNYRIDMIYDDGKQAELGSTGMNRFDGIFQVKVRRFADGNGTYALMEGAAAVAAAFKRGTIVTYSTQKATCRVPTMKYLGQLEAEWETVVVRVPFWAYTTP